MGIYVAGSGINGGSTTGWVSRDDRDGLQSAGGSDGRLMEGSDGGWIWNEDVLEEDEDALRVDEEDEDE